MTSRRRPARMAHKAWIEFLEMNPAYECKACGDTDESRSSVDRIRPGANGGGYTPDNCQWLCISCNSRKNAGEDAYWRRNLYFDQTVSRKALRTAQAEGCYDRVIANASVFARPWSELAGNLLLFSWFTGVGKTLLIPTLASALNFVVQKERGLASPRVGTMLVLTIGEGARDQIARDLSGDKDSPGDIVRYGVLPTSPKVGVIKSGSILDDPRCLRRKDIWVACVHMFFQKNGAHRPNMAEVLAQFDVIVFDEPHVANGQVQSILDHAYRSLSFGTTASPVDAAGSLISKMVLFSLVDYDLAVQKDQCLKLIVPPSVGDDWKRQIEVIDPDYSRVQTGDGESADITSCTSNGYDKNILPAISVAERILALVSEWDAAYGTERQMDGDPAIHRPPGAIADVWYPPHPMIQVSCKSEAETLVRVMNETLDRNRNRYPRDKGYQFDYAFSDGTDDEPKASNGKPLDHDHPWFSYKNKGRLSAESCRFLVCIGMGRENTNNPYCNTVGVARRVSSVVEVVQRIFGRPARSVHRWVDGVLHCPPAELDQVKVVTHAVYGNEEAIEKGAIFALDMAGHLANLPSFEQVFGGDKEITPDTTIEPPGVLTTADRFGLTGLYGSFVADGCEIDLTDIVDAWCPAVPGDGRVERRRQEATEWLTTVRDDPGKAKKIHGLTAELSEIPRVVHEEITPAPTEDDLRRHVQVHKPHLSRCLASTDPSVRELLAELYADHQKQYRVADIQAAPDKHTTTIQRSIAAKVRHAIGAAFVGDPGKLFPLAGGAIKHVLGCGPGDQISDGGRFDTPECHAIIERPEVQLMIMGWIKKKLLENGDLPTIAAALRIPIPTEGGGE